ncbi:MAG TPA: class II aldolase/adducin family protein [Stellaceae bacterium]|nr:class II aldolase/adducin family protein [Stellaceae bacterium]
MSNKSKRRNLPGVGRRGFIQAATLAGATALTPPLVAEAAPIAPDVAAKIAGPPQLAEERTMSDVELAIRDLVIANRVLAHENVVDAYGHVSMRHPHNPERYLLSRSRAPELIEVGDIVEYTLDGESANGDKRPPYLERFIHGAIYEARPDVHAVVHAHSVEVLPFSISTTRLRPVIHDGAFIGAEVPVWDIADKFGHETDLLVSNMAQGRDLARRLGSNSMALMRGHGFAAAAPSLYEVVRLAVYAPRNAHVLQAALLLGGKMKPLSKGEIRTRVEGPTLKPNTAAAQRAWEYWAQRAGVSDLLPPRPTK